MRALRGLMCAVALTACLAPATTYADEYNKQTILTFSGPVQLPGLALGAGTYQFKLADPESGRQLLQVWDKDGTKLLATLMTIPDQRMTPTDEPTVMFKETASGEPQAIRAWFYPSETYGQEFVYPKAQAMKIAKATHSPVLAYEGDAKDESAFKAAKVGRVDENGAMSADAASTATTADNQATPTAPTTTASSATAHDGIASSAPDPTADTTHPTPAISPRQAAAAEPPVAVPPQAATPMRQQAPAAAAASPQATTPTPRTAPAAQQPVGTSGSIQGNGVNSNQSATRSALPRTASPLGTIELIAGALLLAAFAVRTYRLRRLS